MQLTRTRTITQVIEEVTILKAPEHWGCFSSVSNRSLRDKAATAIRKADAKKDPRNALAAFIRGWERMGKNPKHVDAGVTDTAVREFVWDFCTQYAQALGKSSDWADAIWEEVRG